MGPPRLTPDRLAALDAYRQLMDRARALDPEGFKPTMMPYYSADQQNRQSIAMMKARAEVPAPPTGTGHS